MKTPPIRFSWDGEVMRPEGSWFAVRAAKAFEPGRTYTLTEHVERSNQTHNHYFAAIADAWSNIPDPLRDEYPSAEHLRKKALIRSGYCSERSIVCGSERDALKVAAFVTPIDAYSIVLAEGCVVRVFTAESQSRKAMGAKRFQASKEAVFAFLDRLLNVPVGTVQDSAGKGA